MTTKNVEIDVAKEMASMPQLSMTPEEFGEELRKTLKNISIRPTMEQAKRLIYLDHQLHFPKAKAVKLCLDIALPKIEEDLMKGIEQLIISARFQSIHSDLAKKIGERVGKGRSRKGSA
jgi:hypothetical protein